MKENKHTVKMLDLIVSENMQSVFIVMNYIENDLKSVLLQKKTLVLTEDHTISILYKMLCALNFLHKANVIHRDLKPSHILIDECCNIAICDFSLARTFYKFDSQRKEYTRKKMAEKLMQLKP